MRVEVVGDGERVEVATQGGEVLAAVVAEVVDSSRGRRR